MFSSTGKELRTAYDKVANLSRRMTSLLDEITGIVGRAAKPTCRTEVMLRLNFTEDSRRLVVVQIGEAEAHLTSLAPKLKTLGDLLAQVQAGERQVAATFLTLVGELDAAEREENTLRQQLSSPRRETEGWPLKLSAKLDLSFDKHEGQPLVPLAKAEVMRAQATYDGAEGLAARLRYRVEGLQRLLTEAKVPDFATG